MVVDDLYIRRAKAGPEEANPVLVIDPDTHLSLTVSLECFEPVPWWNSKIIKSACYLKLSQFALCDFLDCLKAFDPMAVGQALGLRTSKRDDHP